MSVDPSIILGEGPWTHRMIAANGGRFHTAVAGPDDGDAPLVILLHGFPQFWWAWRHQLAMLGEAGYRVAAMDLRGYGGSDKPPSGNGIPSMAADVAGVVRSLGANRAVVIGHGIGGQVAWTMPSLAPGVTRAIGVLGAPHPVFLHSVAHRAAPARTLAHLAQFQLPWFPERAMTHGNLVEQLLHAWSAPGWRCPDVDLYTDAARLPFVAHSAMEQLRWLVRSTPRADGRRYRSSVSAPVRVPVLSLHGKSDRNLFPRACRRDHLMVRSRYSRVVVDGAGHFLPEEAADEVGELILAWLAELP
ncbi:MAG: alpha/beta hydrolase [Actinomycetales bacterium]|nr:alpha/beta hydrolase [Actinomycetales bacterium]